MFDTSPLERPVKWHEDEKMRDELTFGVYSELNSRKIMVKQVNKMMQSLQLGSNRVFMKDGSRTITRNCSSLFVSAIFTTCFIKTEKIIKHWAGWVWLNFCVIRISLDCEIRGFSKQKEWRPLWKRFSSYDKPPPCDWALVRGSLAGHTHF